MPWPFDQNYDSDNDSDFDGGSYPFDGDFDRSHDLRGRTVVSSGRVPSHVTQTRRQTHYSYDRGTDTTAETRDAAQTNVPTRIRNSWATGSGESGSWETDNPPPQRSGTTWAGWGAALGAAAGFAAGSEFGQGFSTSVIGPTAGRALGNIGGTLAAPLGGAIGYGIGSAIDYMTAPRYDAGHTRSNAIGGLGDRTDTTFGQNPRINRGQYLNGRPTYDSHRRHERDEARAVRKSSSSLHTTTLYYDKRK